ncbi:MAG: hypothetical protein ACKO2G_09515 [Verrucomicrobiales bacterium]
MKEDLRYDTDTADTTAVIDHFARCDPEFIRLLDSRVERAEYARKIAVKSTRFEAWSDESLVGLVAVYFGMENQPSAHISNISVTVGHVGRGIDPFFCSGVLKPQS